MSHYEIGPPPDDLAAMALAVELPADVLTTSAEDAERAAQLAAQLAALPLDGGPRSAETPSTTQLPAEPASTRQRPAQARAQPTAPGQEPRP